MYCHYVLCNHTAGFCNFFSISTWSPSTAISGSVRCTKIKPWFVHFKAWQWPSPRVFRISQVLGCKIPFVQPIQFKRPQDLKERMKNLRLPAWPLWAQRGRESALTALLKTERKELCCCCWGALWYTIRLLFQTHTAMVSTILQPKMSLFRWIIGWLELGLLWF